MASPKQLVIVKLEAAIETCSSALEVVSNALHDSEGADLIVLHKDFTSILSLLHGSTTKLSLALKPPSPTYSASLTPLKDISEQISALSHCVCLFGPIHGLTLTQEFTSIAKDVVRAVKSLLRTFLAIEASGNNKSTGKAGDEYMVRIGAVHEIIDNARSSLSKDNIASVQKRFAQNHNSLEDGLQEVDEMANGIPANGTIDDEWEDDGWGELGIDSKQRMSDDELMRTKKVHDILRLSTLLHKRIMKDILSPPSHSPLKLPSDVVQHLDCFPPQSTALLVASDDLTSTLYTPQSPSDVATELASFLRVINDLRSTLLRLVQEPALEKQMSTMSLQGSGVPKDPKKWFDACFVQIQKAIGNLDSTLHQER